MSSRPRPCLGRGVALCGLFCKWAPWPSIRVPTTCDCAPKPARGCHRGFHQPTSSSLAAIPSRGSLVATHDYYWNQLGSTSTKSPSLGAEYPADAIPQHPGLPRADPGPWWVNFIWGKSILSFTATVLESPEHSESPQASSRTITCDMALEATRKAMAKPMPVCSYCLFSNPKDLPDFSYILESFYLLTLFIHCLWV
uniref:Pancreatic progenitor cell differentiation and proliferation factor n=1 Tax=Ursus americanus TaxID=9643 RepID=A0A452R5I8_URSAM